MRFRLWVMALAVLPTASAVLWLWIGRLVPLAPAFYALGVGLLVGLLLAWRLFGEIARSMARLRGVARRLRAAQDVVKDLPEPADAKDLGQLSALLASLSKDLRNAWAQARQSRQQMEAIFTQMPNGILVVDGDLRIQHVNPAAQDLLALTPTRTLGRTVIEATMHHALDRLLRKAITTGSTHSMRLETIQPRRRVLQALVTPLEEGGAVAVFQDLTEFDHLERVRRDFVANVSHELRTPVTTIKVMAESLRRGALRDVHLAEEFLHSIAEAADRLARLVDDLLALARAEAGPGPLEWKEFRLDHLVKEVVSTQSSWAQQYGIELIAEVLEPTSIRADPEGMRQAITNLVTNAIQYNKPGGSVRLRLSRTNQGILLSVADTGVGIAAEHLPRIFERFYRVDRGRSRELGGTGLGLAIVKRAVEAHGGQVTAESTLGQGSTFTITLPLRLLVQESGQGQGPSRNRGQR